MHSFPSEIIEIQATLRAVLHQYSPSEKKDGREDLDSLEAELKAVGLWEVAPELPHEQWGPFLFVVALETGRACITWPLWQSVLFGALLPSISQFSISQSSIFQGSVPAAERVSGVIDSYHALTLPGIDSHYLVEGTKVSVATSFSRVLSLDKPREILQSTQWQEAATISDEGSRTMQRLFFLGVAAEILGACQWAFKTTHSYVKTREQYGKPIGSFQAVQHMLASSYVSFETARALTERAAIIPDVFLAQAALCRVEEIAVSLVEQSIQLHGGTGFTWEYPLHWYLRRVATLSQLYRISGERVLEGVAY